MLHDWHKIFFIALNSFNLLINQYILQQFEVIHSKWDWNRLALIGAANANGLPYTYNPKKRHTIEYYLYNNLAHIYICIYDPIPRRSFWTNNYKKISVKFEIQITDNLWHLQLFFWLRFCNNINNQYLNIYILDVISILYAMKKNEEEKNSVCCVHVYRNCLFFSK